MKIINILSRFEDEGWRGRIIERASVFAYHRAEKKVYFRVYPTLVLYPLGEATSLEEAVERAKQFLSEWLSLDRKHVEFRLRVAAEILRLEQEKREGQPKR